MCGKQSFIPKIKETKQGSCHFKLKFDEGGRIIENLEVRWTLGANVQK